MNRAFGLGLLLASFFLAAPAEAQTVHRVGVLHLGSAKPGVFSPLSDSLFERLAQLGYQPGKNLVLERRWAEGKFDQIGPLTADLLRSDVKVIVTIGNKMVPLVQAANPRVPIVSLSCDSFYSVASYAKPDGNFTGVTCMSTELSPKRLELAKQLFPHAKRAVYLHNPTQGDVGLDLTRKAAGQLGVSIRPVEIHSPKELAKALEAVAADRPDFLLVYPDALTMVYRKTITDFAEAQRLPTVYAYKEFAEAGGLVSYGSTLTELGQRAADLVDKILRGSKPHELPLEQATRVYLTVNLKAARSQGIAIPQSILLRADRVID